ncbi:MAG: glutamate--tRNA ligase [Methylotenera sp.]|uniref:glutamate--tRNA ligase n=1 Tax=Methylotenera sp. TaxID=2051956 RepID=UPI002725744D|nr:glutamate--tRNA ligase [Methylotenera sp.]MDO9204307.1 glutamate--tRNA ligase [Methylotenera sp.]MDO9392940.1 glutamate--tRNA ligase [Methylotenera sp.]MDP2229851.1 glutamate--tRNA ligase [Methylotenera sp.]MDP3141707.1 glutamate--tRNA ligase [Methylotenera sp.]MDP3306713.1 glutamate--tRNA ligase [Methylotenera sp.]
MIVRTRFAPSPTGFLHIGGARTALFSWAFAKKHGGTFILRIEDTDVARSTPEAVQAILDGMQWLGLDYDEGPFYQMQRMDRYKQVIQTMLDAGSAYYCYSSKEELDALREQQMANKQKPRYEGKWRPEAGKVLPAAPNDVPPVIRFKNPQDGVVAWDDLVKGRIEIANSELDDLIIARADGTPTYNFCVVVDDSDMGITQVIRGDDHVNNTPRQINLLKALAEIDSTIIVPQYAHLSMILGNDGQKLSKRHGAVSVMQYDEDGYLPEAVINYLARLGWSHGDEEVFSKQQFAEWFDLDHITPSAAQFNTEKLNWLNNHYIKAANLEVLAKDITQRLGRMGIAIATQPAIKEAIALYRDRANTLNELAQSIAYFYSKPQIDEVAKEKHITSDILPVLNTLATQLVSIDWTVEAIHAAIEYAVTSNALKFPKVAMPLRVMLTGGAQSPSIDAVMAILGKDEVLARMNVTLN